MAQGLCQRQAPPCRTLGRSQDKQKLSFKQVYDFELGHRHSQQSWGRAPVGLVDGERGLLKEVWRAGQRTDRFKRSWDLWFLEPLVGKKRRVSLGADNIIIVLIATTYCFGSLSECRAESDLHFCHLVCWRGSAQVCFWELCQKRSLCRQEQERLLSTKFWLQKDFALGRTGYSRASKGTKIKRRRKNKSKTNCQSQTYPEEQQAWEAVGQNANYWFIWFFFLFL